MSTGTPDEPLLDEQHAAFIQGAVSMIAASRDAWNLPAIARAIGCRVSADRRRVRIVLAAPEAAALLECVRATRRLAVVFSEPSTHRTIQLKGSDAAVVPLTAEDLEASERYVPAFVGMLGPLGHSAPLVETVLWCDPADKVAVEFTVGEAFSQTPGPRAGTPLHA